MALSGCHTGRRPGIHASCYSSRVNFAQLLFPDFSLILIGYLLCRFTPLKYEGTPHFPVTASSAKIGLWKSI